MLSLSLFLTSGPNRLLRWFLGATTGRCCRRCRRSTWTLFGTRSEVVYNCIKGVWWLGFSSGLGCYSWPRSNHFIFPRQFLFYEEGNWIRSTLKPRFPALKFFASSNNSLNLDTVPWQIGNKGIKTTILACDPMVVHLWDAFVLGDLWSSI